MTNETKIYQMKDGDSLTMTKKQLLEWKEKIEEPLIKEINEYKFWNVQNERTLQLTRMDLLEVLKKKKSKEFQIAKKRFNLTKKEILK